jgi:hypothetical protein
MRRVVVLGGTGEMGAAVATLLRDRGDEVVAASRATGVDVTTGAGLDEALAGADTVVDCLNVTTMSKKKAVDFFTSAATNVVTAAATAGVGHIVCLSIVNVTDPGVRRATGYYAGLLGGLARVVPGATDPRSHDGVVQPRRDLPVPDQGRAGRRRPRHATATRAPRCCCGLRRGCRRVRPSIRLTSRPSARGASARRPGAARRGGDGARGGAHPASGSARGPPPAADGRVARGAAPAGRRPDRPPQVQRLARRGLIDPERGQKVSPVSRS